MAFDLCPEGWKLYDVWSALLDAKARGPECRAAKAAYYDHRAACPACTKPPEVTHADVD